MINVMVGAAMATAFVAGGPPPVVMGVGFLVIVLVLVTLRPTGTKLSAVVAHERLQLALQSAMLRVMMADGALDPLEAKRAAEIYRELTAIAIPEDALLLQAELALADEDDVRGMLDLLAPELSPEERLTVLKGTVVVAVADGDLKAAERPVVTQVAETLGLSAEDVRAVVAELSAGRA